MEDTKVCLGRGGFGICLHASYWTRAVILLI